MNDKMLNRLVGKFNKQVIRFMRRHKLSEADFKKMLLEYCKNWFSAEQMIESGAESELFAKYQEAKEELKNGYEK